MSLDVHKKYKRGDKIGDRYLVHEAIFTGGMSEVYLCTHLNEGLPFALKTIKSGDIMNPKYHTSFEREIQTWISLENHPNIVRCFALEELEHRRFMILEWITSEGEKTMSLSDKLKRSNTIQPRETLDIIIDICRGLLHAQSRVPGMVHRDLKPANILMAHGAVAKITDFGLAGLVSKNIEPADEINDPYWGKVQPTSIAGTPNYMAPEQWRGLPLDEHTDLYAIG
jgi:eukaryotic-like serine/threonine-protein kinase